MSKQLIYLTLPAIAEAIESTLSTCPYCCYRNIFTIPEQRRRLFLYILKHIRNRYTVLIDDPQTSLNCASVFLSPEQYLQIEELAQQGICHLLPEICTWNSFPMERSRCNRVAPEAEFNEKKDETINR